MNSYFNYFQEAAEQSKTIRHGQAQSLTDTTVRNGFYRSDAELSIKQNSQASYPLLLVHPYRGRMREGSDGDLYNLAVFEIRQNVSDAADHAAINAAYQECERIAQALIKRIIYSSEDDGWNGPFPGFDVDSVQYDFTGPHNNNEYACRVQFEFKGNDFSKYDDNLSTEFDDR
jgi:hypothetical protein